MQAKTVKTSSEGWLVELASAYRERQPIIIVDDANTGINPTRESLYQMGVKAGLSRQEWIGVVIGLGVAGTGALLVIMAIFDPEPFSKLGFVIGAGAVMTMGGGFAAMQILTKLKPPRIKVGKGTFEISWEDVA